LDIRGGIAECWSMLRRPVLLTKEMSAESGMDMWLRSAYDLRVFPVSPRANGERKLSTRGVSEGSVPLDDDDHRCDGGSGLGAARLWAWDWISDRSGDTRGAVRIALRCDDTLPLFTMYTVQKSGAPLEMVVGMSALNRTKPPLPVAPRTSFSTAACATNSMIDLATSCSSSTTSLHWMSLRAQKHRNGRKRSIMCGSVGCLNPAASSTPLEWPLVLTWTRTRVWPFWTSESMAHLSAFWLFLSLSLSMHTATSG
jgi:hypothetical protein